MDKRSLRAALALLVSGFSINHLGSQTHCEFTLWPTVLILEFFRWKVTETQSDLVYAPGGSIDSRFQISGQAGAELSVTHSNAVRAGLLRMSETFCFSECQLNSPTWALSTRLGLLLDSQILAFITREENTLFP